MSAKRKSTDPVFGGVLVRRSSGTWVWADTGEPEPRVRDWRLGRRRAVIFHASVVRDLFERFGKSRRSRT